MWPSWPHNYFVPHALKPVQTVAPSAPLLTLDEVKRHCRVELPQPDDDAVLNGLMLAATAYLDGYSGVLGRALINQTWRINLSCWPACRLRLPFSPVSSIVSIKYYDAANVQQALSAANWSLLEDARSPYAGWALNASLPSLYERADAIEVLFVAGYGATADTVPEAIRVAAKILIATWFENREASVVERATLEKLPFSVDALLSPFRRVGF